MFPNRVTGKGFRSLGSGILIPTWLYAILSLAVSFSRYLPVPQNP